MEERTIVKHSAEWKVCPVCGDLLNTDVRYGKSRQGCSNCGWTRFTDPKVAVATFIETEKGILLVQRKNSPFMNLWTLPAGFMDRDEDPRRAAERECFEETGLIVSVTKLRDIYYGKDHRNGADFVLFFDAQVVSGIEEAKDDAKSVGWFRRDNLPSLAFQSTRYVLYGEGSESNEGTDNRGTTFSDRW